MLKPDAPTREYRNTYYTKNKAKCNKYSREWYAKNRESIRSRYASDTEYREELKSKKRANTRRNRELVLSKYGGSCACCGESTYEFLAVDHITGDGNKHRKAIGRKGGEAFYTWLIKNEFPVGFRVLCHNCNVSRGLYKACPHEKVVTSFIRSGLGLPAIAA